jgi:NADH dehydrogenase
MKSIIIFGGSGYVGRNLIRRFAKEGHKVIVSYQKQTNEANLRFLGSVGQIVPFHFTSLQNPKLLALLNNADICINLKTSWSSNKSELTRSILDFNSELINELKRSTSIKRFIFFSGLGTENRSTFRNEIISKTEDQILKKIQNSVVIRPSVILGNNDQFLSNLLPIFKMSFFIPLFGDGSNKFQPVLIDDVVEFVSKTIEKTNIDKQLFELAGPEIFTYKEFYSLIADALNKKRVFIPSPMLIMKPLVSIGEKLPFFLINSEQLSLFETDNILKNKESGFDYFAISPKRVISAIKKSL